MLKLGDVLIYEQPTKYIVKSENYNDSFPIPVLTPGQTFILGYTDETDGIYLKPLPVIIFDDFTTATKLVNFPFKVKSSAMKILKPANNEVFLPYWYYFLSSLKVDNELHKRYWISVFANKQVSCPSFLEQKRIAGILDKVQSLIALQKQQLEKLDLLIKSKFIDMFGDPSCLESVTVPLKTYAQISGGYAFPSDKFLSAGIPIIRISNLQNGSVVSSSKCCFSPQFLSSHSEYAVQYEDILLAMSGATVGKTAIYKQKNPALLNQRIACLRNIDKVSCTAFLYIITKMKWFYDSILNLSAGCAQPNISISQIQGLLVPKASFVRQRQFSCFYYNIEKQKVLLKNRLASLETLYKSLMQEYFG